HRAPFDPAFHALVPAHFSPRPAPSSAGAIGRRPDGPRRSMKVMPAPRAMPMSAAVRRSYCWSVRSPARTVAAGDARGARRVRLVVGLGRVIVAIFVSLLVVVGRHEIVPIDLDRRNLRPSAADDV